MNKGNNTRRKFIKNLGLGTAAISMRNMLGASIVQPDNHFAQRPNIILVMSDDQGWGDVGYNGNPIVKTPHLDAMSKEGIRFDRFYAGAPVCSPTRGSCLTGRNPYRYGVPLANVGSLPSEEVTLAEALKGIGYRTGHFGKWHLGTLTKTEKDGVQGGPDHPEHYSPPWENGFDVCFSNEAGIPLYNPYTQPRGLNGEKTLIMDRPVEKGERGDKWRSIYWEGPGKKVTDNITGTNSRIIMDRAVNFIKNETTANNPFFSTIWFHTPHSPVIAGERHRSLYSDLPMKAQHWYGCLTAMDEQIGRMRAVLEQLGIAENTIIWFCSDNGPSWIHDYNSAGPFRGEKGTLYEGGIRVPATLVWPSKISQSVVTDIPCVTSDFYPTISEITGFNVSNQPLPIDGVSLLSLINGEMKERPSPIGFQSEMDPFERDVKAFESAEQLSLIDNRYKILSLDNGKSYRLYDLLSDPGETTDLSEEQPYTANRMVKTLEKWIESCRNSNAGKDYY